MAGLPGYAPAAPKTLQAAQAQVHAIDQQQGFNTARPGNASLPPVDGPGFVAPGDGIGSAVRYDIATGYHGNDPAHPVNFATGAGMVQGGSGPVQGLPGVAVMPGVTRVGNTYSNTSDPLPPGVTQDGNSFTNVPPASLKQHLDAALTAHLQKSIQSAALPSWFNQEQRGLNGENQLHQVQATQQAQNAARAAHLQAVQQQAQNSPITTGLNAAIHSVGSGVLGDVGGLAGGLGDLTGWKGAQQFGHNLIGASIQQAGKATQQEAALSKAKGLGSYVGAGIATLAPYLLGPEVAANTFAQNAALQGAQNGDSFGRNLAGAALQGAAGVAGAPEARMVEDALHGIAKNSIARAVGQSALYGAEGGALGGAGQSVTNDQTFGQGVENTVENAGLGTLLGGGAGALTHGASSLAAKVLARKPAAEPDEAMPTTAAEPDLEQQPTAEPAEDVPADDEFTRMLANIEAMKQTKPAEAEPEVTPAAEATPEANPNSELENSTGVPTLQNGQLFPNPLEAVKAKEAQPVDSAQNELAKGNIAAAAAPANAEVSTEQKEASVNPEHTLPPGLTLPQAEMAENAPSAEERSDAHKVVEQLEKQPPIKPATPEQEAAINAQTPKEPPTPAEETAAAFGATPLQPFIDKLRNSPNGQSTVKEFAASLAQKNDSPLKSIKDKAERKVAAQQAIHALVDQGHAVLYGKDNNKGPSFILVHQENPEMASNRPSTPVQVVQWHLENQVRKQLQAEKQTATGARLKQIKTKLLHSDFSNEPLVNPSIHEPWMQNHFGISKDDAGDAVKSLVGSNELEVLTPQDAAELAKQHGRSLDEQEVAANTPSNSYILSAQDPRLTGTRLSTNAKDLQGYGQQFLGARKSELLNKVMPSQVEQEKLNTLVDRTLNVGGDSFHHATAGEHNDEIGENAAAQQVSADQKRDVEQAPVTELDPNDPATLQKLQETKDRLANKLNPLNVPNNLDDADLSTDTGEQPEQLKGSKKTTQPKKNNGLEDELARISKERAAVDPNSKHAKTRLKDLDDQENFARNNPDFYNTTLPSIATAAASHGVAPTPAMQKLVDFVDQILGKGRAHVVLEHHPGTFGYTDLQKIALTAKGVMHDAHRVLTHEAAHIIRELYLTDAEKKMTDQALAPGTRRYEKLLTIAYKNGIPQVIKNQPYERFSYYAEAISKGLIPKPTGILGRIYSKVLGHMERLHNALRGAGYKNIDDIMQAIQEGKFAERGPVRSLEEGRRNLSSDVQHSRELNSVAPDKKPSILDREMGYNIHNAMQEADDPSFIRKAAGFGAHVALGAHEMGKQLADQGSVPSVKAHMEAAFRPLWRAWENRYRTGREVESKVGHVAPIWFDPTLRNALKYRAARSTASKMLQDGDHERKVFDEDTLRSRYNANPDAIEAYQQALKAANVMHDYDIQRSTESLAQKRKMALEAAADINKKLASPVEKERAAALKQAETLAKSMKEAEALHKKTVAHTKRLRDEGYIPHFREGKYLLHVKASLPTGELAMRKYMQKLEKAMPETQKRLMDPKTSSRTKTQLSKKMEVMSELHARYQQALQNGEFGDQVHLITTGHHFLADAMGTGKKNEKLLKEQSDILKEYGIDPKHITTSVERKPAPVEGSMGMEAAQRLLEGLGDDGLPLSTKQRVALFRQMVDSESTGFNKRVARKDIAGEDDDVRKALAHWAVFTGEQMGAHRTAGERADAMRELRKSGSPELAAYAEAYEKGLHADGAQPGFEKAIRSATGLAMLGGNLKAPLYALQNMPFAMANLSRNERGMGSLRYTKALKDVVGLTAHKLGAAVDKGEAVPGLTKAETQTMWKAHQAGDLAPQYANLVLGAHGGSSVGRQAVEHALMSPLAVTENHLRMATYLAALRQHAALLKAGKKPLGLDMDAQGKRQAEMNPETYARDMSNLSNQNYQREDTIPLLGKLGDLRTMLQFATPQARNLSMLHHMARTNPLIGAALVAGAAGLGGYQALPLAEDAESGYDGLSAWMATHGYHLGSLGDGQGAQALINQGLIKNLPPKLAELAMHGGLHNVFGTDLSEFAGLGNNVGNNLVQLGADVANQNLHMIPADQAAPATSFVMGGVNTARSAANGNWMQAARSLPIPLVENLIRAAEAAKLGRFTTPTGSTVMKSSPAQIAAATIGLPTTKLQDSYDELGQARYAQTVSQLVKAQALQDIQQAMEQPGSKGLAAKGNQIIQSYTKAAPWSHEFITGQDYSELMRRHMLNSLTPMERLRLGEYSGRGLKPTPPVAVHP